MKNKFISILLSLIFVLLPTLSVNAQRQDACMYVNADNYKSCCETGYILQETQRDRCDSYIRSQNTGVLGGSQNAPTTQTTPVNTTVAPGTIAPTPQAQASELSSCNAIAFDSLFDILIWLKCVIATAIIPLIFTLAFLFFLWGMVQYIRNADNEKKREESKKFIYYGIIGLTVMVSVWGIVRVVTSTFGLGNAVPQLQTDCLSTDKDNPCKK